MDLSNKKILLTGATGGIGAELAHQLTNKGAVLALTGRNIDKLNTVVDTLKAKQQHTVAIQADLNTAGAIEQLVTNTKAQLSGLDIVICNAGVLDFTELDHQSEAAIDAIIQTNVTALIKLSRTALKQFKSQQQGHFVFIGSVLGSIGFPHLATYSASKFAVRGFSQALRRELVDTNIGVTYIAPRGIKTAMTDGKTREMFEAGGNTLDTPEKVASRIVKGLEQEKQEVFIGQPESMFAWLNGVMPRLVNLGLKSQVRLAKKYLP